MSLLLLINKKKNEKNRFTTYLLVVLSCNLENTFYVLIFVICSNNIDICTSIIY